MGRRKLGRAVRLRDDWISSIARVVGRLYPGDETREAGAHDRQGQCKSQHRVIFRRARRAQWRPHGRTDSRFGVRVEAESEEQDGAQEQVLQRRVQLLRELQPGDSEFYGGYVDYYHSKQYDDGFI